MITGQMADATDLIKALENAGYNVYPVQSMTRFMSFIEEVQPDAVINMAHGRMGDKMVDYLKARNILLFAPLTINSLVDANKIVICCGGGGIPVVLNGHHLKGASAVIDKDYASCLLAKELDADMLIILTAVEKVAVNFGKENEEWLDDITVDDAKKYINEGQFAPGSMLPKVQAAVDFASSKEGRTAMITLLQKAKDGIQGKTGTKIHL